MGHKVGISIIAVTAAIGIAACGSSKPSPSGPSPLTTTPTTAAQQGPFYNMGTLAQHFTVKYNAQPGPKLKSVTCMMTGAQQATCMGTLYGTSNPSQDNQPYGQRVSISTDGYSWMTLGSGN